MAEEFTEKLNNMSKDIQSMTYEKYDTMKSRIEELQEITFEHRDDYFVTENDYLKAMKFIQLAYTEIEKFKGKPKPIRKYLHINIQIDFGDDDFHEENYITFGHGCFIRRTIWLYLRERPLHFVRHFLSEYLYLTTYREQDEYLENFESQNRLYNDDRTMRERTEDKCYIDKLVGYINVYERNYGYTPAVYMDEIDEKLRIRNLQLIRFDDDRPYIPNIYLGFGSNFSVLHNFLDSMRINPLSRLHSSG